MKVRIEKDIDVDRLLINIESKLQCKSIDTYGHEVKVEKQLLRDVRDVIMELMKSRDEVPKYKIGQVFSINTDIFLSRRRYMPVKGFFQVTDIKNEDGIRYYISRIDGTDTFSVSEEVLDRSTPLIGGVA